MFGVNCFDYTFAKKTLCFEYVFAPKAWTKMVTYIEANI